MAEEKTVSEIISEVPEVGQPYLIVNATDMATIDFWMNLAAEDKNEISGFGTIEPIKEKGQTIALHVQEIFLPEQTNNGSLSDIADEDMSKFCASLEEYQLERFKFWWHSHVQMPTFWSSTDKKTVDEFRSRDFFVSLVTNVKHDVLVRLDYYSPFHVHVNQIPLFINVDLSQNKIKQILFDEYNNFGYVDPTCFFNKDILSEATKKKLQNEFNTKVKTNKSKNGITTGQVYAWNGHDWTPNDKEKSSIVISTKNDSDYFENLFTLCQIQKHLKDKKNNSFIFEPSELNLLDNFDIRQLEFEKRISNSILLEEYTPQFLETVRRTCLKIKQFPTETLIEFIQIIPEEFKTLFLARPTKITPIFQRYYTKKMRAYYLLEKIIPETYVLELLWLNSIDIEEKNADELNKEAYNWFTYRWIQIENDVDNIQLFNEIQGIYCISALLELYWRKQYSLVYILERTWAITRLCDTIQEKGDMVEYKKSTSVDIDEVVTLTDDISDIVS
jgi:hypothetical protein